MAMTREEEEEEGDKERRLPNTWASASTPASTSAEERRERVTSKGKRDLAEREGEANKRRPSVENILAQVVPEIEVQGEGNHFTAVEAVAGRSTPSEKRERVNKEMNNLVVLDRVRKQLGLPELTYCLKTDAGGVKPGSGPTERRWKPWTREEDDKIASGYVEGRSIKQMLELLPNRTYCAVEKRRQKLKFQGILDPSMGQECWTEEENRIIDKCLKSNMNVQQILDSNVLPGRTYYAILAKVDRVKEKISNKKTASLGQWTEDEDDVIAMGVRNDTPIQALLEYLPGRSYGTVKQRRHLLLSKGSLGKESHIKERKFWTDEEDQVIIKLLNDQVPANAFGVYLPGRSKAAISMRRKMLKSVLQDDSNDNNNGARGKGKKYVSGNNNSSNKRSAHSALSSGKGKVVKFSLTTTNGNNSRVPMFAGRKGYGGKKAEAKLCNWRPEEDQIVIDNSMQRNSLATIMSMLPGRTKAAIESRRYLLRARDLLKDNHSHHKKNSKNSNGTPTPTTKGPETIEIMNSEEDDMSPPQATKPKRAGPTTTATATEMPPPEAVTAGPSTSNGGYNDVWSEINDLIERAKSKSASHCRS